MKKQSIQERYSELLRRYVNNPEEEALAATADLGRELVLAGIPPEDIGEIHTEAFRRMTQELPDMTLPDAASLISAPLMELLMAYGLAFRERAEALKEYSERLEGMVEERTKELRDAQEELIRREKLATLGQIAGAMAHELRNPLGAIKNAAYFLNMVIEEPDPEVKETLEILDKEVGTSERIISSLLDFARTKPPIRRKVYVNHVLQEALSRTTVPENVEVVEQLDETLPTIQADPDQLAQVFGNLILNGIQAMPEGGRLLVKTSEVSGKPPRSGWVAVSFADTGVGIPEENLDKLFEPLFTTKAKGIGLGLALVKMLVEGHGGSIEVESPSTEFIPSPALSEVEGEAEGLRTGEVGKGSTFTVRLPMSSRKKE